MCGVAWKIKSYVWHVLEVKVTMPLMIEYERFQSSMEYVAKLKMLIKCSMKCRNEITLFFSTFRYVLYGHV
ncbi:hypothetical protein LXL04_034816 [Taraxacum kok-saghyz]